ncbi:hypothetical protein AT15_01425 [Kosmotoga arenicorallina S304]|uniref:Uncharacterized protein n=1 Tax=Kosmotoga arenicorallina S304 TaxID=1453497 RepID=A0A176K0F5_9BACT|nr:hypothetical protein [Kosmotoga arenicorallina]OAA29729.1 hypothetical protein AT15_01425 [Kosmotoga arenicorallina S304]
MKRTALLLVLLATTSILFAFDPFLVQTGGNQALARGYWASYGSPSDLYGILFHGFSPQVLEYRRSGETTYERELHLALYDPSDGGMAGILEYVFDVGLVGNYRALSYLVSSGLNPATNFGTKIQFEVENITSPPTNTYWLSISAGITGITLPYLEYIAAFKNAVLWSSSSTAFAERLDVLVGLRLVFDLFHMGFEVGTRNGMNVRYAGVSAELQLFPGFMLRGGFSYNADLNWEYFDRVVGGGIEFKAGKMKFSAGFGANLDNTIRDNNIDIPFMWGATFCGEW